MWYFIFFSKSRAIQRYSLLLTIIIFGTSTCSFAQPDIIHQDNAPHDFDFNAGVWHTHIYMLAEPLSGSKKWKEFEGVVTVRKVWDGRAQVEEIEAKGREGRFEGLTLFLYNPRSRQWSMSFANSDDGNVDQPSIGGFKNGVGEFYQQSELHGRSIMVRMIWSAITPTSHRVEQAYSDDGGKHWEANFIGTLTKLDQQPNTLQSAVSKSANHDFDFALGHWKEHTQRLLNPLTQSKTWMKMEGKSVNYNIWNGNGNVTELESEGPDGNLELLALRLYNPRAKQWNLTFATSKAGVLSLPQLSGEFKNGRGEFFDQELLDGRVIWVRFTITSLGPDSMRSEQAFSDNGGKTWETNWINTYNR